MKEDWFILTLYTPGNGEIVHLYGPFDSKEKAEREKASMEAFNELYYSPAEIAKSKIWIRKPISIPSTKKEEE